MKENAADCPLLAWNRPLKGLTPRFVEIQAHGGFAPVFHFHIVLFFGPPAPNFFPSPSCANPERGSPISTTMAPRVFWTPAFDAENRGFFFKALENAEKLHSLRFFLMLPQIPENGVLIVELVRMLDCERHLLKSLNCTC